MLVVLSAALILGLIGFAVHALWVVIVIALGHIAANSRRDPLTTPGQNATRNAYCAAHIGG